MKLFDLDIFDTLNNNCKEDNYVAIATMRNSNKDYYHSAFIFNVSGKKYEFHFDKGGISLHEVGNIYFYKILSKVKDSLTPAFYAYCNSIKKKANPKYGYFYSGEYYDNKGVHFSQHPIGEYMTCVGFCINILKGFLGEEYIEFKDWDSDTHDSKGYIAQFAKDNNFKVSDILVSHRRITPLEIFTSAYFTELPVAKNSIDVKINEVKVHLDNITL